MTKGTVKGVIANMVTLGVDGPVAQGEICYIETGGDRLMAEVIKVVGSDVYVQVFESTRGLKVGATADFTGHMLEVKLAPGMLSKNFSTTITHFFPSYRSALSIFLFRIPDKPLHSFVHDSQVCSFHLVIQETITNKFRG